MANQDNSTPDSAGETKLRGKDLNGSEQQDSPDHVAYVRKRNPDTVVRVDGEKDSLYNDGLELEGDGEPLAGTRGTNRNS